MNYAKLAYFFLLTLLCIATVLCCNVAINVFRKGLENYELITILVIFLCPLLIWLQQTFIAFLRHYNDVILSEHLKLSQSHKGQENSAKKWREKFIDLLEFVSTHGPERERTYSITKRNPQTGTVSKTKVRVYSLQETIDEQSPDALIVSDAREVIIRILTSLVILLNQRERNQKHILALAALSLKIMRETSEYIHRKNLPSSTLSLLDLMRKISPPFTFHATWKAQQQRRDQKEIADDIFHVLEGLATNGEVFPNKNLHFCEQEDFSIILLKLLALDLHNLDEVHKATASFVDTETGAHPNTSGEDSFFGHTSQVESFEDLPGIHEAIETFLKGNQGM